MLQNNFTGVKIAIQSYVFICNIKAQEMNIKFDSTWGSS